MSSLSTTIFALFLCIFMHACIARRLRMVDSITVQKQAHEILKQDVDDANLYEISLPTGMTSSSMVRKSDEIITKMKEDKQGYKMIDISPQSYPPLNMHEIQGSRTRARLMLEKYSMKAMEETVDYKEKKNKVEDVVVMDYAGPHKKPPIHNEEH